MRIQVLLAEAHPLVRAGIRTLLSNCPEITVAAEAANTADALRAAGLHRPTLALVDAGLPPHGGVAAIRSLRRQQPGLPVILLSMDTSPALVRAATEAGADGVVLKHLVHDLEPAVRAVAAGSRYFSRPVRYALPADAAPGLVREGPGADLTPRQVEILKLIAQGHTTKEIARQLGISVKTAQTHRTQLMERLDIHNVAGLVRYAIRIGLVTPGK